MFSYRLEVQTHEGWFPLAEFTEGVLDVAEAACNRTVFSQKAASRIVGLEDGEIVYEKFYNQADDPDENWRDDEEEDHDISWQEAGF